MIRYEANPEPSASTPTTTFGLLPCLSDRHVHAVYDVADDYPKATCGWNLVPDVYPEGEALLCRRCLAALPDNAELRPACNERRQADVFRVLGDTRPLVRFEWWRLARRYDRRIGLAIAEQWHRG